MRATAYGLARGRKADPEVIGGLGRSMMMSYNHVRNSPDVGQENISVISTPYAYSYMTKAAMIDIFCSSLEAHTFKDYFSIIILVQSYTATRSPSQIKISLTGMMDNS